VKTQTAVTPKAAPVAYAAAKPADALSREEIRGIAQAIARSESGNLRDDLSARLARLEERIGALEKRPVTPPAPAVAPAPVAAPAPTVAPVVFAPIVPAFASAPPPPVAPLPAPVVAAPAPTPAPMIATHAPLLHVPIGVDDTDLPFVSGARRRKRLAVILVLLLLVTVGTIVVAAVVSQAMNNHS
jgi:hypothetical protein